MLVLKLMSREDLPDSDCSKNCTLVQIGDNDILEFADLEVPIGESKYEAVITRAAGHKERFTLIGNAYVQNAQGKTIASRGGF
jgi:hypothetical protein